MDKLIFGVVEGRGPVGNEQLLHKQKCQAVFKMSFISSEYLTILKRQGFGTFVCVGIFTSNKLGLGDPSAEIKEKICMQLVLHTKGQLYEKLNKQFHLV